MATNDTLLRAVLVVIVAVLAVPLVMMTVAMPMAGVMHGGMWGDGTGMAGLWWLWSLLPLAVLIALGYGGYRLLVADGSDDSAMEELRAAYARGDLTDEEFETRRQRLENSK